MVLSFQKMWKIGHAYCCVPVLCVFWKAEYGGHFVEAKNGIVGVAPHLVSDSVPEELLVEVIGLCKEGCVARVLKDLPGANWMSYSRAAVHPRDPVNAKVVRKFSKFTFEWQQLTPGKNVSIGIEFVLTRRCP